MSVATANEPKRRRDPKTGREYILVEGQWAIADETAQRFAPIADADVVRRSNLEKNTWRTADNSIEAVICTDDPIYSQEVKTGRRVKECWLMSGLVFDEHVRVLNDHRREDVREVLGSAADFQVAAHSASARLYLSSAEPAICTKVSEGHIRDVSVGGERLEMVTIPPGRSRTIGTATFTAEPTEPLNVVTRLRVYEVSFTAVGSDPAAVTRSSSSTSTHSQRSISVNKHIRKFLVRSTGMDPKLSDEDAQKHHDGLHEDVRKACRAWADAEEEDERDEEEERKRKAAEDAERSKCEAEKAARSAAAADTDVVRKQALADGAKNEQVRVAKIHELGQGCPDELVQRAIKESMTPEQFAPLALDALRTRTGAVGPFIHSRSLEKDLTADVLSTALVLRKLNDIPSGKPGSTFASNPIEVIRRYEASPLAHSGIGDWRPQNPTRPLEDAQRKHNEMLCNQADRFSRLSLVDICRHCCRLDGLSIDGFTSPQEVVGLALGGVTRAGGGASGGSFGAIFTTSFNAMFLAGYLEAADSTMGWVTEDDAPNFLPGEIATVTKMGNLTMGGKGQASQLTYGDFNEKIQIDRYSGMFEVDEVDLINDRFGALSSVSPQEMGLAARRVRPNLVYSILMGSYTAGTGRGPTLNQDGVQLFSAAHSNFLLASSNDLYTAATGAVGVAGLQTAIPAIMKQRLNGVPLNLRPRFILLPPDLDMAIRIALFSTQRIVAAGSGGTLNPFQAFNLEPRTDSRLDETGSVDPRNKNAAVAGLHYHYFLVCRPGEEGAKTMVVRYLSGTGRAPQIRSYVLGGPGAPGRWGIGWDVKLDLGAAVEDFRSMYYAESTT